MKALALFGVCLSAKALVLLGRPLPASPWTPLAYLWQDVLFVLLFALFEAAARRRLVVGMYVAASAYVALNVPIACELATPLTWPLLRGARATLADSILHHLTFLNILRIAVVAVIAAVLPRLVTPMTRRPRWALALVAVGTAVVLAGPSASARVASSGRHRNAVVALVATALPRVAAADLAGDFRVSPFGCPTSEDLTELRGAAAGRSVVVIHLESTGAAALKPYGAALDPMPHLTALARDALIFDNAYTTYPETIKSFFATQCGVLPALDTRAEVYEGPHAPSLAALLAVRGYRTGLFHSGRFGYLGMDAVVRGRGYDTAEDAGGIGGDRESSFGIDEPSAVRRMLAWVDGLDRAAPFLLTYLPIAGHHPYDAPGRRPFDPRDDRSRWLNALHYADESVAALLDGLRTRGLLDRCLIVVVGDHGEAFGEHDGNTGHMLFLYEENVKVPFVIAAPGRFAGRRTARVVSLVDLAPTVLDLLGLSEPTEAQGRSLLRPEERLAIFCTDYSQGLAGLRDGRWKAIHDFDSGRTQLFDLTSDPGEKADLSETLAERASTYREHLISASAAQKYRVTRGHFSAGR